MKHRTSKDKVRRIERLNDNCPHPEKWAFLEKKKAKLAAKNIRAGLRVYRCQCGRYHLTKSRT